MLSPYMLIVLGKAQEGTYVLLIGCAVHQNRRIPLASSYTNDVYLLLGKLVGILLYSMLLCMKSPTPTVLFGFGGQCIRKLVCIFPCENSPFEKEKRTTKRRRETGKSVVLFHHASPSTPGLFRIEFFPKER